MSRLCSTTLRIGEPAPPFALFALNEQVVQLAEVLDEVPLILVFAPGAWSPSTRRQLEELSTLYERLQAADIGLLEIITQDARSLRRRLATQMPPFPVLADEQREAARSYGVFRAFSWDGIGVTRPAVFLIDRSSLVRFMYVGERDGDLPETEAVIHLASALFGLPVPETVQPRDGVVEPTAGRLVAVLDEILWAEDLAEHAREEQPSDLADAEAGKGELPGVVNELAPSLETTEGMGRSPSDPAAADEEGTGVLVPGHPPKRRKERRQPTEEPTAKVDG